MEPKPFTLEELNAANARIQSMSEDELKEYRERLYASLPPEAQETLRRLDAVQQQPRTELVALTREALRSLPSDDLEYAICTYVDHHLAAREDVQAALQELPRGLQVCYLSFIFGMEVMNGGVNQFFWNPSASMASLVPAALYELGSPEAAKLLEQIMRIAEEEAKRRPVPASFTIEEFMASYAETELNKFDDLLCPLIEKFPQLLRQYLRDHEDSFLQ
ncbi:DMP19 family protein [Duganella guangzhouensis]|nr:DUF4375 domain-containing protein [Duganella guangzhouensis]